MISGKSANFFSVLIVMTCFEASFT